MNRDRFGPTEAYRKGLGLGFFTTALREYKKVTTVCHFDPVMNSPLLSAAPPFIILATTMAPVVSSLLTVAP